jgi:hypothetical protein
MTSAEEDAAAALYALTPASPQLEAVRPIALGPSARWRNRWSASEGSTAPPWLIWGALRGGVAYQSRTARLSLNDTGLGTQRLVIDPLCPYDDVAPCATGGSGWLEAEAHAEWRGRVALVLQQRLILAQSGQQDPGAEGAQPGEAGVGELRQLYGAARLGPFELVAGRAAIGFGPSDRTQLVLSHHAPPLDHVRLVLLPVGLGSATVGPNGRYTLPWATFSALYFLGRLRDARPYTGALLTGFRMQAGVPLAGLTLGMSQAIMVGGEGAPDFSTLDFFKEYLMRGRVGPENDGGISNRVLGFDLAFAPWFLPGVRFYTEFAIDDDHDFVTMVKYTASQLGGIDYHRPFHTGLLSLRGEYQRTPMFVYRHGLYPDGWTHQFRGLAAPYGSDAESVYLGARWQAEGWTAQLWGEYARLRNHRYRDNAVNRFLTPVVPDYEVTLVELRPVEHHLLVGANAELETRWGRPRASLSFDRITNRRLTEGDSVLEARVEVGWSIALDRASRGH